MKYVKLRLQTAVLERDLYDKEGKKELRPYIDDIVSTNNLFQINMITREERDKRVNLIYQDAEVKLNQPKEVKPAKEPKVPYNTNALKKWSWTIIQAPDKGSSLAYKMETVSLMKLKEIDGYKSFSKKLNELYRNYNEQNYLNLYKEFQEHNEIRKERFIRKKKIADADYGASIQYESLIEHFSQVKEEPNWLHNTHIKVKIYFNFLTDQKDPYEYTGLHNLEDLPHIVPHMDVTVERKILSQYLNKTFAKIKAYTQELGLDLSDRKIWRRTKLVDVSYQNKMNRELLLAKAKVCYNLEPEYDLCVTQTKTEYTLPERLVKDYNEYGEPYYYSRQELEKADVTNLIHNELVGKIKLTNQTLRELAEDTILIQAAWMKQFDNTESDLRNCKEVEGDAEHNKMVPIENLQDIYEEDIVELRDFQEPLYAEDEDNYEYLQDEDDSTQYEEEDEEDEDDDYTD